MKIVKRILFIFLGILVLSVVSFMLFLGLAQILEYQPRPNLVLVNRQTSGDTAKLKPPTELSLLSWNIGYSGLDEGADFILEGGRLSRARSREAVEENISGILDVLQHNPADFYFLQEVDLDSSRSYGIDQVEALEGAFPAYRSWYATNFKVFFVPFPPFAPIGPVQSGMVSLSRFPVTSAIRLQLPGQYGWPLRLFHLKRCLMVLRLPSGVAGKDWVLIQLHLSAYDSGGALRKQQLDFVADYLHKTTSLGHYVIIGGDWNSLFPGTTKETFGSYSTEEENLFWVQPLPPDWTLEGWTWGFEPDIPTCRSLEQPFRRGENFMCIVDGFLISPNLEVVSARGLDLNFRYTDHNPLLIKVRIKE